MSLSRKELRENVVEKVNALTREELLDGFGISRVAELTNLDTIGLPVFSCVRALAKTISIHSGKGLDPRFSRAGAIVEGIELAAGEQPHGEFRICPAIDIPNQNRLDLIDCFPIRSAILNDLTPIAWEEITDIQSGKKKFIPSDLIWMVGRLKTDVMHFQMGSNGLGGGCTVEDAILGALYEIIERDAWTLSFFLQDSAGLQPRRSPLIALPPKLEHCVRQIEKAESRLHLFDITTDYNVPAFGAIILDLSGQCAGTFGGYGCHLDAEVAAIRAITEAAQARCCYISGARDDLFRRQFLLMKRMDQDKLDKMFNKLPSSIPITSYKKLNFPDVRAELRYLLRSVKTNGLSQVYVKELGSFLDGTIQVVRVISPQCEAFRSDMWSPSLRCISYTQRKLLEFTRAKVVAPVKEEEPDEEEGEEWKKA